MIVVYFTFKYAKRPLDNKIILSLGKILSFVIIVLFVMIFFDKLTHIYFPARQGVLFLFTGPYWPLFWIFQIGMGIVAPLLILFNPKTNKNIKWVLIAAASVVIGVLGERAAIVIPGTAQVQELFPGEIQGQWGAAGIFPITLWESLLTIGIVAFVAFLFVIALKYLDILPKAPEEAAKHE